MYYEPANHQLRLYYFFFSSRRRHTRFSRDWSSDVCSSDLDEHVLVGGVSDDRARIRCDVDDARPGTQQVGAGEDGKQFHGRGQLSFDDVERPSLPVPVVGVYARSHHQLALVRLGDVHVYGVGHDDGRVHRLQQFGDQRLERMGLQRGAHAQLVQQHRGVARGAQCDGAAADVATGGPHPGHPVADYGEPGDLTVLDQVDSRLIDAAGESPGDVVVLGDSRTRLVGRSLNGVADVLGDVDDRADPGDFLRFEPFRVDAVELVGLDATDRVADVLFGVRQVEHSALGEQDRVVQLLFQSLPQFQGVFVDRRGFVPEVVRPDQRGVAGHVTAGEPASLQHRDVGDPVVLRQVVSGRQAVSTATDDHHVVVL